MIKGEIVKGKELPAQLRKASNATISGVERTVQMLAIKLVGMVQKKLSGDVLAVRTGRLRRSINHKMERNEKAVTASVGTNVKYAYVHEVGGSFDVPEHLRMQTMQFGKKMETPKQVTVKAHKVNFPKRSFLVASLNQMDTEIREKLAQAIISGIELK